MLEIQVLLGNCPNLCLDFFFKLGCDVFKLDQILEMIVLAGIT